MRPEVICLNISTENIERLIAGPQLHQTLGAYQTMLFRTELIILVGLVRSATQAALLLTLT